MKIGNRSVGSKSEPFMIAEISANHSGSIERAKKTILAAQRSGAHAVKIQTYTADSMTFDSGGEEFVIQEGLWKGRKLFDLYQEAHLPLEWHKELFDFAANNMITLFSTPFDEDSVDFLVNLGTPALKISSFELTDVHLIRHAASKNKPLLLSTGTSSLEEIGLAVETARSGGANDLLLLHCISNYPADVSDMNLMNICALQKEFGLSVGLSDHSLSNLASIGAICLGAVVIEKHFKLDDIENSADDVFSLLPNQFANLVSECKAAYLARGSLEFTRPGSEENNLKFRRSLYFGQDLSAGHIVLESDIRRVRPGYGLSCKYLSKIVGKKLIKNVKKAEPVKWDAFNLGDRSV